MGLQHFQITAGLPLAMQVHLLLMVWTCMMLETTVYTYLMSEEVRVQILQSTCYYVSHKLAGMHAAINALL